MYDKLIVLKYEPDFGWKHPIQAYAYANINGKLQYYYHYFAEFNNYLSALNFFKHAHQHHTVIIYGVNIEFRFNQFT
jgi:hypothetical protein